MVGSAAARSNLRRQWLEEPVRPGARIPATVACGQSAEPVEIGGEVQVHVAPRGGVRKATPDHTSRRRGGQDVRVEVRVGGHGLVRRDNHRRALVNVDDQAMLGVRADALKVDEATHLGVVADPQVAVAAERNRPADAVERQRHNEEHRWALAAPTRTGRSQHWASPDFDDHRCCRTPTMQ